MDLNRLPDDVLPDLARQYTNKIRRRSYARHPETAMRQRLRNAVYLLDRFNLMGLSAEQALDAIPRKVVTPNE